MTAAQWNEYQRQADVIDEAKKWKEEQNQTAVNWLINEIKHIIPNDFLGKFEQAKEMEQGKICLAFLEGQNHNEKLPSQYYIETYGSKGSDENFKQFSLYEHKETITSADTVTSSQTEISDEEIEKCVGDGMHDFYKGGFIEGAKWYREQLKQRQ